MAFIADDTKEGEDITVRCVSCPDATKHVVLKRVNKEFWHEFDGVTYFATYQVIQCKGCESVSFRRVASDTMSYIEHGPEKGTFDTSDTLYPERQKRTILDDLNLHDADVYEIPEIIQDIYKQTLSAVQHELVTLAGIGVRAVIEAVCTEEKAKGGNLEKKIDNLVVVGLLTSDGAKILHGIRLLGNESAHEMKPPTVKQIQAALKVIDHLLLGVYVLPAEAKVLPKPKAGKKK